MTKEILFLFLEKVSNYLNQTKGIYLYLCIDVLRLLWYWCNDVLVDVRYL